MIVSKDSIFSPLAVILFMMVGLLTLVFFVHHRDAGGFLGWIFVFAAFVSSGNSSNSPVDLP